MSEGSEVPEDLLEPLVAALERIKAALPKEIPTDMAGMEAMDALERELVRAEWRKDPRLVPYLDGPDDAPELEAEFIVLGVDLEVEDSLRGFVDRQATRTSELGEEAAIELGMDEITGAVARVKSELDKDFQDALERIDIQGAQDPSVRRVTLFAREIRSCPDIAQRLREFFRAEVRGKFESMGESDVRDALKGKLKPDSPSSEPD